MKRWGIILLAILAAGLVGGIGYLGTQSVTEPKVAPVKFPQTIEVTRGDVRQSVTAPGELVQAGWTVLSFSVSGKLDVLDGGDGHRLRPGDHVRVGQILARLNTVPLERILEEAQIKLSLAEVEYTRQLADAELTVQFAQLRLEQSQIDHSRRITQAQQVLQTTQARLVQAQLQYPDPTTAEIVLNQARADEAYTRDEYNKALDRPWEPQTVRDGALRALNAAQDTLTIVEAEYQAALNNRAAKDQDLVLLALDVEQAEARLADIRKGSDPFPALDLHKAQTALADLRASGVDPLLRLAVEKARTDLDAATLIAPSDGVVLEVRAVAGETVNAGVSLIVLANPGDVEIEVSVVEEDVPLVATGQLVELFFDAAPDEMPLGMVARVVPQRISGDRPLYPVYITPQGDLPDGLFPGMTVDAAIIVEQRTNVLRLPRSLVRSRPDSTATVEVWAGRAIEAREVTVGLRGDVYVEIVSGLQKNDRVISQ